MSIRTKTLVGIGICVLILVVTIYLVSSTIILSGFSQLETQVARQDTERIISAIDSEKAELDRVNLDWANRDDTYAFMVDHNQAYIDSNLVSTTYRDNHVNIMAFFQTNNQLLYGRWYQPSNQAVAELTQEDITSINQVGLLKSPGNPANGLIRLPEGILLFSFRPIFNAQGLGPEHGDLLVGRLLDQTELERLSTLTHLSLTFQPVFQGANSGIPGLISHFTPANPIQIVIVDANTLSGNYLLYDQASQPAVLIKYEAPRIIYQEGRKAVEYLIFALGSFGVLFLLLSLYLTDRMVLSRLVGLNRQVASIGRMEDPSRRIIMNSSDEFSNLAASINKMLEELQRTHQARIESDERYRAVVEQAQEGFALVDVNTLQVTDANRAFCSLLGISPQTVRDLTLFHFVRRSEQTLEQIKHGRPFGGEFRISRENGAFLDVEVNVTLVSYNGKQLYYVIARNISGRKRMQNELQRRLDESLLFNRAIAASTSALEPTVVLSTICVELARYFNLPTSHAALLDETNHGFRIVAESISLDSPPRMGHYINIEDDAALETLCDTHAPVVISESKLTFRDGKVEISHYSPLATSVMIVPLIIRNQVIGILTLHAVDEREFTQEELALALNIALSASQAMENARLYTELQEKLIKQRWAEAALERREEYLGALVEVQRLLLTSHREDIYYSRVLEPLGLASGANRVYIFTNRLDEDGNLVASQKAEWVAEGVASEIANPYLQDIPYDKLLGQWKTRLIEEGIISGGPEVLPQEIRLSLKYQAIASILVLPLTVNRGFFGFIGFDNYDPNRKWEKSEIALLQVASSAISLAEEQNLAETALRQSEANYRLVVDSVKEVIFQVDLQGNWMFLNRAWQDISGYSPGESIGKPFLDAFFPEDRDQAKALYQSLVDRTVESNQIEIRNLAKDGKIGWLAIFARLTRDDRGEPVGISGMLTDITQRQIMENERRRSEESIRALYTITASQSMDFTGKVQALLVMGCEHFGMDDGVLAQIVDDRLRIVETYSREKRLSQGDTFDLDKTYSREVLVAGAPISINHASTEGWHNHPGYTHFKIEAYLGVPVMVTGVVYGTLSFSSQKSHPVGFTAVDREFLRLMAQWVGGEIERQQYIQQLQNYAQEIEKSNQDLAVARDQALDASRLKSEFLATMSHEIRTPMNAVIGMTELILGTGLTTEQMEYASTVRDSAQVLLTLINDILDFSKIEAGKMNLESIEFDPVSIIEGTTELFAARSHEKGLSLMSYVDPTIPRRMRGDPVRLQQILINLIGNAVKFTSRGEIYVKVIPEHTSNVEMMLRFEVRDTGIGLSEVGRKRLFQPFTQADGSTTRKYGGTGLGLAISKRLVELMGGEIGVESQVDVGSTFWFTAVFSLYTTVEALSAAIYPDGLSGLRVVVADESGTHRQILNMYLQSWGIKVDEALDSQQALDLFRSAQGYPYQLGIIDLALPGMDGVSLLSEIRKNKLAESTRFILVTAFDQRNLGERALKDGFAAFMTKPVKQSELFDAVMNAITGEASLVPAGDVDILRGAVLESQPIKKQGGEDIGVKGLVLLAEDNLANQRLAIVQLKKLGYQAEPVSNGHQAVEAILAGPERYVLVLMDCQMPEMDGFEAVRAIRKAEEASKKHVPVVAMTANAMQGDREACIAAGMDDYISKPVSIDSLREALAQWGRKTIIEKSESKPTMMAGRKSLVRKGPQTAGLVRQVTGYESFRIDNVAIEKKATPESDHPGVGKVLDQSILNNIRAMQGDGDPDFLGEIIDIFLTDSPEIVERIRIAVKARNGEQIRQAAHNLKGNSANLGANRLADACLNLERMGRSNILDGVDLALSQLESEYKATLEALAREREKKVNPEA